MIPRFEVVKSIPTGNDRNDTYFDISMRNLSSTVNVAKGNMAARHPTIFHRPQFEWSISSINRLVTSVTFPTVLPYGILHCTKWFNWLSLWSLSLEISNLVNCFCLCLRLRPWMYFTAHTQEVLPSCQEKSIMHISQNTKALSFLNKNFNQIAAFPIYIHDSYTEIGVQLMPRPHHAREIWKLCFPSQTASSVFRPHYAKEIWTRNDQRSFWICVLRKLSGQAKALFCVHSTTQRWRFHIPPV